MQTQHPWTHPSQKSKLRRLSGQKLPPVGTSVRMLDALSQAARAVLANSHILEEIKMQKMHGSQA